MQFQAVRFNFSYNVYQQLDISFAVFSSLFSKLASDQSVLFFNFFNSSILLIISLLYNIGSPELSYRYKYDFCTFYEVNHV